MTTSSPTLTLSPATRIGVLCGGLSAEREVSLRSGRNCLEALHRLNFPNAMLIDVDRDIAAQLQKHHIEVAYLALHGTYGEDGAIQGLLELMGIPYTGNRVLASAVTMDKAATKALCAQAGFPVLPSTLLNSPNQLTETPYTGTYPVMVKPISQGSSVGMHKVNTPDALEAAVADAFRFSAQVMLEPYSAGQSITVGVIAQDKTLTALPILELRTKTEWYDEAAKYTEGLTTFVLPAELSPAITQAIQETTLRAHQALGCRGVSRTDYMVTPEGQYYLLEVNSIPGMTDLSDLPAQAKAAEISYDELVLAVLQSALHPDPIQWQCVSGFHTAPVAATAHA